MVENKLGELEQRGDIILNENDILLNNKKDKSEKKELEPNVFETSIKEDIKIFPLLVECSLHLNIRQIKMPFSILFNYIELNHIFNSFPKSDKLIEVLVFKFQINIGDEQFCPPVSIKWVNKRNKKNKVLNYIG